MFHPAHVDGRTVVVLRRRTGWFGPRFSVVASGRLEHDGQTLSLVAPGVTRAVTADELASLMLVRPDTRIAECRGYDLFLVHEADG
jgi:hypothetical protein